MVKKILCIVIENKLQFVVKTKRAGFKVQKINGDNYIEIDEYLGTFKNFSIIWTNFCEQVGIYENEAISAILVVDSQKKNHLEFSEYILNRLIDSHNKTIPSNSEFEWTKYELEMILTTIKDSILEDFTFTDSSIRRMDTPLDILKSRNTLITYTNKKDDGSKLIKIKDDINDLFDTDNNEKKTSEIAINHVACYLEGSSDVTQVDKPIASLSFGKSVLDSISETEELKYLKEKTKNFNHKVRSPR